MNTNTKNCPDNSKLLEYVLQELPFGDMKLLEEHFYTCSKCVDTVRMYSEVYSELQTLKARPEYGTTYKNSSYDVAMLPAAGSYQNQGVSQAKSMGGKYLIKLIPFLNSNKSLLEIQVLDNTIKGILTIENEYDKIFESPITNGFARQEVINPIDLKNILIKVQPNE